MVKATCASIRHSLPDTPICVIVDGDFEITELESLYNAIPLYLKDLQSAELRALCPGSGRSKLAALWEGPFDRFLYLDSDAIIWGDIKQVLGHNTADFIAFSSANVVNTESSISHFFFDIKLLQEINPNFHWEQRPYFCTGAFVASLDMFPLEHYLELEHLSKKHPSLFKFWEQGMLNYAIFSESDKGGLRYTVQDLQYIPVDHSAFECKERFQLHLLSPPTSVSNPVVIHFCGRKPLLQNLNAYSKPFTAFRLLHYRNLFGHNLLGITRALAKIFSEEISILIPKIRRRFSPMVRLSSSLSDK